MKASSARYLVGQGMKSIWRNRMMSFASFCIILVSLLMVGMSVLVTINLNRIISGIEDQSEAAVTIKDNIGEERQKALQKEIEAISNVATVEFYSKDEAWKSMKDKTNESFQGKQVMSQGSGAEPRGCPTEDLLLLLLVQMT